MKSLFATVGAILTGLTFRIVLTLLTRCKLSAIVDVIFPLPSPTPAPLDHGLAVTRFPGSNFGVYVVLSAILSLLNGCVGSSIAQFLFRHLASRTGSRVWQSLVIGVIIGFFSANLQEVLRNKSIMIIAPLIYSLITALVGLLGCYLAGRKYRQRVSQ